MSPECGGKGKMSTEEYLNEEKYQKTNKKMKKVGTIMMIIGGILLSLFFVSIFMQFASFGSNKPDFNPMLFGIFGVAGVFGLPIFAAGAYIRFVISNGRNITSYLAQQQMPVAKEGIEKATPVVSKAAGSVAKEVAKGIKEGTKDEPKDKIEKSK